MKKQTATLFMILVSLLGNAPIYAEQTANQTDWKEKPKESFSEPEETFNLVMKKLLDQYVDKEVTKNDLYRAATAGMLEALNDGPDPWNRLLSPNELAAMHSELSGKVSGIGIGMKWDEGQGYGHVIHVISGSAAEKAGLKVDDQILSVNGQKFKGKPFHDLVYAIRGKSGETVRIKVLREDRVLDLKINREAIPWNEVEFRKVSPSTDYLTLSYFTEDTPGQVKAKLQEINQHKVKNLILDLRANSGGGFDQAIQAANLFLPENAVIVKTKDRAGSEKIYRAKGSLLDPSIHLTTLVNHDTSCAGELLAAALREVRKATLVGTTTFGKWNLQTVETLPNHFAVKYTVGNFFSPSGESFQRTGLKPDLEIPLANDGGLEEVRQISDFKKRLEKDAQLRAAIEMDRAG